MTERPGATRTPPTWRDVLRSSAEAAMGFYLLAALNDWPSVPRWMLLSYGWLALTLGVLSAVVAGVLLVMDR